MTAAACPAARPLGGAVGAREPPARACLPSRRETGGSLPAGQRGGSHVVTEHTPTRCLWVLGGSFCLHRCRFIVPRTACVSYVTGHTDSVSRGSFCHKQCLENSILVHVHIHTYSFMVKMALKISEGTFFCIWAWPLYF